MSERIKAILESLPAVLAGSATAIGALWAALWSRRTSRAEVTKKEAEATAAAATARREADRLEHEAYAQGFGGLKELVEYFQGVVRTLRTENDELRARLAGLELRVQDLQAAHRTCEAETAKLRQELASLKDRAA
jgi:chromosome segregation ATPase